MGLDLTNQTACTQDVIHRMESVGNEAGKLFADIMNFTFKTQSEAYGLAGGPVHDATCIGYLIDPGCITTKDMYVVVDVNEGPAMDVPSVMSWGSQRRPPMSGSAQA